MSAVIIDYGSGNLRSAAKAFARAAEDHGPREEILVSADPDLVARADRIVLPGVGAFADCMAGLGAIDGMVEALTLAVTGKGRPFLGICIGMQLMASRGFEHGPHRGLDWIAGDVVPLEPDDKHLKIPHMGWNTISLSSPSHPVLQGLGEGDAHADADAHAYFVHSFQFKPARSQDSLAVTDYGGPVTAIVGRDNMIGTQFHPEKSQAVGLRLIANFLTWSP